jgi:hypothetical protein
MLCRVLGCRTRSESADYEYAKTGTLAVLGKDMSMVQRKLHLVLLGLVFLAYPPAWADAHGPAFGYSTTVLGAGDTGIELAVMRRLGTTMLGPVVSYGLRQNLQLSVSAPFHLNHGEHPVGRFDALMPGVPAVEGLVSWRVYHKLSGVAKRNEATLFGGFSATTQQLPRTDGRPLEREPGYYGAASAARITRRYYVSAGAGYEYYGAWNSGNLDRQSSTFLSSFVVGWRPPAFDRDYPKPDVRFFLETTGDWVGQASRDLAQITGGPPPPPHTHIIRAAAAQTGVGVLPNSGGSGIFSGPSGLFTYKNMGFQGGVQFALRDQRNGSQPAERYRVVIGVSYFFLGGKK